MKRLMGYERYNDGACSGYVGTKSFYIHSLQIYMIGLYYIL